VVSSFQETLTQEFIDAFNDLVPLKIEAFIIFNIPYNRKQFALKKTTSQPIILSHLDSSDELEIHNLLAQHPDRNETIVSHIYID
jgi:hypothetical protein